MKRFSFTFLIPTFLFLMLAFPSLAATTWYVSPDGNDSNPGSSQGSPLKTINSAEAKATSGDQIHVWQGIYHLPATITLTNEVYLGGGYYNNWGSQTTDPSATIISGEGIYRCMHGSGLSSATTIENFTIQNGINPEWHGEGAGLFLQNSSPNIKNCLFASNISNWYGGGICNSSFSSPTISNCTFISNSTTLGGGAIYNNSYSSPTITNCFFVSNSAKGGGGISNDDSCTPNIKNCIFTLNSASEKGGAISNYSSSPIITNCTISSNEGNGIYNYGISGFPSSPTIFNSIIYGNSGVNISNEGVTSPAVTYTCIGGGCPGTGNISADPLLVSAGAGDVHLMLGSPCINAGTGEASALGLGYLQGYGTNPDGIHGDSGIVDMGYHYYYSGYTEAALAIWYVDASVGGPGNGTIGSPFKTINSAEAALVGSGEIRVKQGIYHLSSTITLKDGVYLRGGYNSSWVQTTEASTTIISGEGSVRCMYGSGLSSATTIENFTIKNGYSDNGGGLYLTSSSPTITNCTFTLNYGVSYYGGGIYNGNSSPTITNCTFILNYGYYGGGIYNSNSSPTITNCIFTSNSGSGAGICNGISSSPTITNCIFTSNSASSGSRGGGIYNYNSSSPTIESCTFTLNIAGFGGGGIYNSNSSPTITNSIIYYQTSGGSISNDGNSLPSVIYSCIEGGYPTGTGNISAEPLFVDGVHLQTVPVVSPCIDAGTGEASALGLGYQQHYGTNPDGIHGDSGIVNMGYHYNGYTTAEALALCYVDASVIGPGSGTKSDPFKTINSAEAALVYGGEVHVRQGTYSLTVYGSNNPGTINLKDGVYLRGGYDKNNWNIQTTEASTTIISGEGSVRCMYGDGLSSAATIENFTIQNGSVEADCGGGLYLTGSSPTIKNCAFTSNGRISQLSSCGGGIYNNASSPEVTNCTFTSNSAYYGGGIYNTTSSSPTLSNCTFTSNSAVYCGGIYNNASSPTIKNCAFNFNWSSPGDGGGIYNVSSSPTIESCTFTSNSTYYYGGGIYNNFSSPKISNCTFTSNSAANGGGIYNYDCSSPKISNCTFTSNSAANGGGIYNTDSFCSPTITNSIIYNNAGGNINGSSSIVTYSCIGGVGGSYSGTGIISADPKFVNAPTDVHLKLGSPCIDAGIGEAFALGLGYQQGYGTNPDGIHGDSSIVDMGYHYSGYTQEAIPLSTYTTKVGSAESWQWRQVNEGELVPSGSAESWQWKQWPTGGNIPKGTAPSWTWESE